MLFWLQCRRCNTLLLTRCAIVAAFSGANQKLKGLARLLHDQSITVLEETHLSRRSVSIATTLAIKSRCFGFGSYGAQAAGGIYCYVKQEFLETHFAWARWDELVPGRIGKLTCCGDRRALVVYVVHMFPTDDRIRKKNTYKLYART